MDICLCFRHNEDFCMFATLLEKRENLTLGDTNKTVSIYKVCFPESPCWHGSGLESAIERELCEICKVEMKTRPGFLGDSCNHVGESCEIAAASM